MLANVRSVQYEFNCLLNVLTLFSLHPTLQEEKLDGENRYFCETCQSKQNATRRIKLHSLPPTLNLQLMRFVFDRSAITLYFSDLSFLWWFHLNGGRISTK